MNKIAVIGTGYVGLVTGSCLSDFGHSVTCVDSDASKIDSLARGVIPIYEPGLDAIVERNVYYKRLSFTTDINNAVLDNDVIFIAVGTPQNEDGSANLSYVKDVAATIAGHMNGYKVIVNKSTVPVGTGKLVKEIISNELKNRGCNYEFDIVSNPEFLREGSAVYDFTHPDRVVIGSESEKARQIMKNVYRVLYINEAPFIDVSIETAEMIKYASNAFLALKITYINEIANLCEKVGADVLDVAKAMGRDGRIGSKFLHPGPGYGGSCFPKDTCALADLGKKNGVRLSLIEATIEANNNQKLLMVNKIISKLGCNQGNKLAVLGLSFKPNTDDMREAPSVVIINELFKRGFTFKAYDPVAMSSAKAALENINDSIEYCASEYEAVDGCDGVVVLTEWNQFRSLDLNKIKSLLKQPNFFDFRNIYKRGYMEQYGFNYEGVGQ
ncbi:MAG: UDP-glucose/GDP-mannose dehydrogenase family protein [Clostridia bacterium]|nr:UDP-glucose/GDP-mannose dehydrogenase family protein [Clostridia bacterium]